MEEDSKESPVANFYKDKGIFITGATGFLGKVLVEKVLRSCPDVKAVYCLMRSKKNQQPTERFEKYLQNKVFDRLRDENPNNLHKIKLISGDVMEEGLGISLEDRKVLIEEVNVVFHSAAVIKFNEPLKFALEMNAFGTRKVIQLCKELKKLKAFIHVSTCYSNSTRSEIDEIIYAPPMHPEKLYEVLSNSSPEIVVDKDIIGDHENTYTFTKAIAEYITATEAADIPAAIVRPSIVTCALHEPFPGWIDNLNALTGPTVGIHRGILRSIICDKKCNVDLVPVDMVVNSLIVVAAQLKNNSKDGVVVYNCSSGTQNPVTWENVLENMLGSARNFPSKHMLFYPSCTFRLNKLVHFFMNFFLHFMPAFLLDGYFRLQGQKTTAMQIYRTMQETTKVARFVSVREWNFISNNMTNLYTSLNKVDRKRFNINFQTIQWKEYFNVYIKGINKYLLKDDSAASLDAMKKLQMFYWINLFCKLSLAIAALSTLHSFYVAAQ